MALQEIQMTKHEEKKTLTTMRGQVVSFGSHCGIEKKFRKPPIAGWVGEKPLESESIVGIVPTRVGYANGKSCFWRFAMARKADETRLSEVQQFLLENQGEKASYYAKTLGIHRYDFNTLLAMLNERGFYLLEDEHGRLWRFDSDQE